MVGDKRTVPLCFENRLTALGESSDVDVLSSAITKQITGQELKDSEQKVINESKYGQRVLNEASPENIKAGAYSSSWAENIGTDRINADVYNTSAEMDGIDGSADNSYNNTDDANTGGNVNGSTNTELLAGRKVSAVGGGNNSVREQGGNTAKLAGYMGVLGTTKRNISQEYRAGESGGLLQKDNSQSGKARHIESLLRTLSGINLSGKDTIGRIINPEIAEKFKNTVFKDENGNLLSLYHWTTATFEKFAKGEFGFHFGTLDAAHDRYMQTKEDNPDTPIGTYKEVYLNITNPISLSEGIGQWTAGWVAFQLKEKGIISQQELDVLEEIKGFYENSYDNPAASAVREILKQNGYDGIVYKNDSEDKGSISVIALYPDQILTVAENGKLKENSGVSEADLDDKSAFSMDENGVSQLTAEGTDGEKLETMSFDNDEAGVGEPLSHEQKVILNTRGEDHTLTNKQRALNRIAEKLGVKLVWDIDGDPALYGNGYYENGVIHLNKQAKAKATVFAHEYIHHIEQSKLWPAFKKFVEGTQAYKNWITLRGNNSDVEQATKNYKARLETNYKKAGKELADSDIIANFMAERFFGGDFEGNVEAEADAESLLREFAKNDKWYHNIIRFARQMISHFKGDKIQEEFYKMERILLKARKEVQKNTPTNTGGRKYSITGSFVDDKGNWYDNAVLLDTSFFDGLSPRNWGNKLKEFIYNRSENNPFIMPIVDENGQVQQLQFANTNDRVRNHKVIDKLSSSSDNISKLAVVHIDEIVEVSEENNPYYTNEHTHEWLDENGWLHRNANVVNQKNGNIYNLTIDIAKSNDGRTILYATNGKIKKVGNVQVNSLKIRGSGLNSNFKNSIPAPYKKVKQNVTNTHKNSVTPASEAETIARLASEGRADEYKTDKTVSKLDAERVAERWLKENKSSFDKAELTANIKRMIELSNSSAWGDVINLANENQRLKQTYVLLSAFNEGTSISPVQFEVKQYVDDSNRLYLAVALTKIETGVMGNTASEKQMRTYLLPVSDISISELFSKINPKDENFLKYVPDELLDEQQKKAKNKRDKGTVLLSPISQLYGM